MPARLTLEDWNLFDDSPAWREATVGTVEERKAKLSDPRIRQALREDFANSKSSDFIFGELPRFIARKVRRSPPPSFVTRIFCLPIWGWLAFTASWDERRRLGPRQQKFSGSVLLFL